MCSLKQARKKACAHVGGDGGQAGLSPALISCLPLPLPFGAGDVHLGCTSLCPGEKDDIN